MMQDTSSHASISNYKLVSDVTKADTLLLKEHGVAPRYRSVETTQTSINSDSKPTELLSTHGKSVVEKTKEPSLMSAPRKDIFMLLLLVTFQLFESMCISVMITFYAKEASKRGVSLTGAGWVLGCVPLAMFIATPIFGETLPVCGVQALMSAGLFSAGISVILFGFLDFVIESPEQFVLFTALSLLLRVLAGVGLAAASVANFTQMSRTFPNSVSTACGLIELASGFGYMLGPTMGGVLYSIGGFVTPFIVLGGIMILTVPVCIYCTAEQKDKLSEASTSSPSVHAGCMWKLLREPAFSVTLFSALLGSLIVAACESTIEPQLRKFNLSTAILGLLFLLECAVYSIACPVVGWIADHMSNTFILLAVGFIVNSAGLLVIAHSSQIWGESETIVFVIVSLVIIGIGGALALVPVYDILISRAISVEVTTSLGMYSTIAGLFSSAYFFGEFVGPVVGTSLVDWIGYTWSMTVVALLSVLMVVPLLMLCLKNERAKF